MTKQRTVVVIGSLKVNRVVTPESVSIPFNGILRKHAYSNILKILHPKTETFQIKILIFFMFLLKTWIVGTR